MDLALHHTPQILYNFINQEPRMFNLIIKWKRLAHKCHHPQHISKANYRVLTKKHFFFLKIQHI